LNRGVVRDADGNGRRTQGRSERERRTAGAPWALSDFGAYEFCLPETAQAFPGGVVINEVTLNAERTALNGGETNWGNLLADSLFWSARDEFGESVLDAAVISSGEITSPTGNVVPGALTPSTLLAAVPTRHRVVVLTLTAEQLRNVLEAALAGTESGSLFPHVSQLYAEYDLAEPAMVTDRADTCSMPLPSALGSRLRTLRLRTSVPFRAPESAVPERDEAVIVNGQVVPEWQESTGRTLRVAMTDFVADNLFTLCPQLNPRRTLCLFSSQALLDYVQRPLAGAITQPGGYRQIPTTLLNARMVAL